jgi:hypothetical protein
MKFSCDAMCSWCLLLNDIFGVTMGSCILWRPCVGKRTSDCILLSLFEKIKVDLGNHHAVCVSACVSFLLTCE